MPIIQVVGLYKKYFVQFEKYVLQNVSLNINEGEFVTFLGPSGSGKSTLLNILGGLDTASAGEIHVNGQEILSMSESKRAKFRRHNIGIIFQAFNLLSDMSAEANVYLAGQLAGLPMSELKKRADYYFKMLQIDELRKHMPSELSGGQQQRFAIARALINHPKILLADEPTGDLDSKTTAEVLSVLYRLNEAGQTTIMVTHDERQAKPGSKIVKISDGKLV